MGGFDALLALGMEVYPADTAGTLVKADIIEPLKACAGNGAYAVVWDKEMLFPAHEDVLALRQVWNVQVALASCLAERSERIKLGPVLQVHFVRRAPVLMFSEKGVFRANYLAFEVRREGWMVFRESCFARCVSSRCTARWFEGFAPCIRK